MPHRIVALLATVVAATTLTLPGAATPSAGAAAATAAAETADPLQVDLTSITPGVLPRRGPIRVSGTVTNLDSETWTTVRLYPFSSSTPLTTGAELAAAAELPVDAYVGDRIVDEQATWTVDEIAPGDSAPFSFEVPRSLVPVTEPGVYWFGVQALGQGPAGRDLVADGRARTLMPLVRPGTTPLDLAVVVPLRRRIDLADDGRVDDLDSWVTALSSGGRLRSLVDLGVSASSRAVTYVVDPALLSVVRQLAAGNPSRSLRPTLPPDAGQGADEPGDGSPSPGGGEPSEEESVQVEASPTAGDVDGDAVQDTEQDGDARAETPAADATTAAARAAAADWLARLDRALAGQEVLALPYGDLDVAAAAEHAPAAYGDARARSAEALAAYDVPATPAVAAPGGYLDEQGLALADPADTVLISDAMFVGPTGDGTGDGTGDTADGTDPATDPSLGGTPPTVITDAGRRLVVTSTASTAGPGPGETTSVLSVRQRTLAEAAVRALGTDAPGGARQPLVLMLPNDWNPVASSGFFSGFDVDWLDLSPVSAIASAAAVPTRLADLTYPRNQTRSALPDTQFAAADELAVAGTRLQNMLTRNDQVGRTVSDQALTTLSYTARSDPARSRLAARAATRWIDERTARVHVEAPKAFTMTGTVGNFSTTLVNDLAQPVTVALSVETDAGLSVTRPTSVAVPASGRTRVLLRATAPEGGIHRVTVGLTDVEGGPLGDVDTLTVRSLQVSNVIWVFLGAAGALLFGAIAFRLVRRLRAARRTRRDRRSGPDAGAAAEEDVPRERVGDRT